MLVTQMWKTGVDASKEARGEAPGGARRAQGPGIGGVV